MQLASYVQSFHPRLVGLTGTPAEIDAVVKAYRVYVRKVADPKSTAGYTIDHTSLIYVMGPDGAYARISRIPPMPMSWPNGSPSCCKPKHSL